MTKLTFDVKIPKNLVPKITKETKKTVTQAVRTIAQDLARTASETAPHLTGDLEDAYAVEYQFSGSKIMATIEFAVFKDGFNYAVAMHEWTYELGAGSSAKSGGTGMSGKSYVVGRKFLTRVHEGESVRYTKYVGEQILKQLGV